MRRLPIIVLVVLAVVLIRAFSGGTPPRLRTSCTHPAVALSKVTQRQHGAVQWSATGPAKTVFELTIGVTSVTVGAGGHLVFVPDDGRTTAQEQRASRQTTMPGSCKTNGSFGILVPPGAYTVRMFSLSGPVTSPTIRELATAPLTVTAH
jgi:hypothetical protein